MTSIKEGWGLTVTEAASQGTSTIGYNVDGLRDSIAASKGGKIVDSNIESMASAIVEFILKNDNDEKVLISSTKNLSAENTYNNFVSICKKNHLFQ
jgi:glycosyltransferase involved in cell wall biosynthesis